VLAHALRPPRRALASGAFPPALRKAAALHAGPKLLVRRVAPTLIAAVDPTSTPALNTLYLLHARAPADDTLFAAAATLNSGPARRWLALTFAGGDRLFPYVRAAWLRAAPVPPPGSPLEARLAELGRRLARDPAATALAEEVDRLLLG
jgi:hypothetical protein